VENLFLAKTKPEESIIQHTENLIKQYQKLKEIYPNINNMDWRLLELACLYHDLGKMNTKFQNKLMKKLGYEELLEDKLLEVDEIPHGYLSPAFLPFDELNEKYSKDEIKILCQSIFYHHNREKLENNEPIKRMIKEDLSKYIDKFNYHRIANIDKLVVTYNKYVAQSKRITDINGYDPQIVDKFIMTKGLLNKIDYAASSGVEVEVKNEELLKSLDVFFHNNHMEPNDLQRYMLEHSNENNLIIASTGIGKTEAALMWIGDNKGFFTLPLRVAINAIYDRLIDKKKIGFPKEKTGLLHSDTASEYLKRNEDILNVTYLDEIKQLSLPITVCTLDQLIDFVFKYDGYELKLATLAYSKLVIDEIQMYAPEMVAYLILALKEITRLGGKFSILTATLPPIFVHFLEAELEGIKINKPKPFLKKKEGKVLLRHKLEVIKSPINCEHVKDKYIDKKVLIIVNTVKKAQEIYKNLKKLNLDTEINMFHSKFIKKDRKEKEENIFDMGQLGYNKKGIWITTQVVEASLDIDFDILYTELSDIAGLLQRMGRVYRNRELKGSSTNIYVYDGGEGTTSGVRNSKKSIIDIDIFSESKKAIQIYHNSELNEKEKMLLVEEVYSVGNLKKSNYYNKIKQTINQLKYLAPYELNKSEVDLRNIENVTIIPREVFKENKESILEAEEKLRSADSLKERIKYKDKIRQYSMDVPAYEIKYLTKKGLITDNKVDVSKYELIPVVNYKYSYEKGLEKPDNLGGFDEEQEFT
jgi:CRISPR-associated endonuclease/helicase Cas3